MFASVSIRLFHERTLCAVRGSWDLSRSFVLVSQRNRTSRVMRETPPMTFQRAQIADQEHLKFVTTRVFRLGETSSPSI